MEEQNLDVQRIQGWGADLEDKFRPASKMWEAPPLGTGAHWNVPEQQPNFRDFHSIERPRTTHVFGDTVRPKGLSGVIRGFAFKYSESSWGHWLPLMLADRINVVEGFFEDLARGKLPNPWKEGGFSADWKYNKPGLAARLFKGGLLMAIPFLAFFLIINRKKET
jgi:hypothetical protein